MFSKNRKSQAGFSLVELMVVVAIIGVLASIAVPSINKYLAKARQTEAKTQLSSLYTSEKAFFAEYTAYDARFSAIGYSPEGKLRYNVGFSAAHMVADATHGYNTTPPNNFTNVSAYCGAAGVINVRNCALLSGADGTAAPPITGSSGSNTPPRFTASSAARLVSGSTTVDRWSIDQNKVMQNTSAGIQ